ncbi:MAG TPA: DUF2934 domain-containing protein [Acetobacteraceae bacterium]|jgi:hypothetical protein|nr:DUF2934 domain-containing protein [Acetobacteraceae bacterium]
MDQAHEQRIRERAYALWEKEGCPDGRDHEFWERARLMLESEATPTPQTPLGQRTPEEVKVDEAAVQSFPASDPPSFTAEVGALAPRPSIHARGSVS